MTPLEAFDEVRMCVGTVIRADVHPRARVPALRLTIDFGELGTKTSSARITDHYTPESLIGTQIVAVVNLPPRNVGGFISECLVLGANDREGRVVLIRPDTPAGGTDLRKVDSGPSKANGDTQERRTVMAGTRVY